MPDAGAGAPGAGAPARGGGADASPRDAPAAAPGPAPPPGAPPPGPAPLASASVGDDTLSGAPPPGGARAAGAGGAGAAGGDPGAAAPGAQVQAAGLVDLRSLALASQSDTEAPSKEAAEAGPSKAKARKVVKAKGPAAQKKKKKWAPNRKPAGFWDPFNVWWRARREALAGKRPPGDEVASWWKENADRTWGAKKPTEQETRKHAKCLRSKNEIVNYFRVYRGNKKKAGGQDDELQPPPPKRPPAPAPQRKAKAKAKAPKRAKAKAKAKAPKAAAAARSVSASLASSGAGDQSDFTAYAAIGPAAAQHFPAVPEVLGEADLGVQGPEPAPGPLHSTALHKPPAPGKATDYIFGMLHERSAFPSQGMAAFAAPEGPPLEGLMSADLASTLVAGDKRGPYDDARAAAAAQPLDLQASFSGPGPRKARAAGAGPLDAGLLAPNQQLLTPQDAHLAFWAAAGVDIDAEVRVREEHLGIDTTGMPCPSAYRLTPLRQ